MDTLFLCITLCLLFERTVIGQKLVSLNKPIVGSSEFEPWYARYAVDGDPNIDKDNTCTCCAAYSPNKIAWFRLDLEQTFMVYSIFVLGRAQFGTLINIDITLGNSTSDGLVLVTNSEAVRTFNYTLPIAKAGKYVTVTQRGETNSYFIICELYVYSVCDGSTYGPECVNTCGQCLNQHCDTVDGTCTTCSPGYKFPMCHECDISYYGPDCKQRCFCADGDCNKTSGLCPTAICSAGYSGEKCNTPCDDKHYGQNCHKTCGKCFGSEGCSKESGTCLNGCEAGFEGKKCIDECDDGTHGLNCQYKCGNCFNNGSCNKIDGGCTSCAAGYKGNTCVDECLTGTFGFNCKQRCGMCLDGDVCDIYTGECPNGCTDEYKGIQCSQEIHQDTCISLPVFIGSLLTVIVVYICTTIVLVWLLCRKRLQKQTHKEENRTDTSIQLSNTPSNYDTLELDNLREESKYTELNRIS